VVFLLAQAQAFSASDRIKIEVEAWAPRSRNVLAYLTLSRYVQRQDLALGRCAALPTAPWTKPRMRCGLRLLRGYRAQRTAATTSDGSSDYA
jgi:hypothetical protein